MEQLAGKEIVAEMRRVLGNTIDMTFLDDWRPRGTGIMAKEKPPQIRWSRLNFIEGASYKEKIKDGKPYFDENGQLMQADDWYHIHKNPPTIKRYPLAICISVGFVTPLIANNVAEMDWIWEDERLRPPSYIVQVENMLQFVWLFNKQTTRPNIELANELRERVDDIMQSYVGSSYTRKAHYYQKSPQVGFNPCLGKMWTSNRRYNGKDLYIIPVREACGYYEVAKETNVYTEKLGPKGGVIRERVTLAKGQLSLFDPNAKGEVI